MLWISLIIIIIFGVGTFLVDYLIRRKQRENTNYLNNNTSEIIVDEVSEIELTNTDYRKQLLLSLYLFIGYYSINIFLSFFAQLILQTVAIKELNITDINILNETSPVFDQSLYEYFLTYTNAFIYFVVYSCLLILLIFIGKKVLLNDFFTFKQKPGRIIAFAGIGIALMYGVNIVLNLIITILDIDFTTTNQSYIEDIFALGGSSRLLLIFYTVICAPIVEELVFRKAIFGFFKKNSIKAVLLSTLIFALIHVISPFISTLISMINNEASINDLFIELLYILVYLPQAFVLSFIFYKSDRNIYPTIIMHMFNNVLSVIGLFLLDII